jgi:carbon-monoxide dehydrogenase medium subunit
MVPVAFDYCRASSVNEALALLAQHGEDAKLLAGGHSMVPALKLRLAEPTTVIDLGGIPALKQITDKGDHIAIGAMATHWMLESSEVLKTKAPALQQAAAAIGDVQVRNRGTIGGALAHCDPAADYPGAILALAAQMVIQGASGERVVNATDYFVDLWETAVQPGELLVEIRVPTTAANANSTYQKYAQPASRYPYVGCAVALEKSGSTCKEVRVGFSGVAPVAFRDTGVEEALRGKEINEANAKAAADLATDGHDVLSDWSVSADYRRAMSRVYARRALMSVA